MVSMRCLPCLISVDIPTSHLAGDSVFFRDFGQQSYYGAHLNPAVTLALVVTKRFPLRKAPLFVCAQMLGGFWVLQ